MFTRRGEARGLRALPESGSTEHQLLEARMAAAQPHQMQLSDPSQLAMAGAPPPPPPIPSAPPVAAHAAPVSDPAEKFSVIGEDLTIEGQSITIRCKGALEINGSIQAELHSRRLVVGKGGRIEGTIAADSVDIWGRVSGTIMGARVTLHESAEVEGDIHTKSLSVSDGASFEGRSRKVADAASIAPRLEPASPPKDGPVTVPVPVSLPQG